MSSWDDFLPTCDSRLNLIAASRLEPFTPRRAVQPTGRLGFFYDAWHDQILNLSNVSFSARSSDSRKTTNCSVKKWNTDEHQSPLSRINMHYELRLSIALEIIPAKGVGALIKHSRPIDKYTRFMCYSHLSRTEYLSDDELEPPNKYRLPMSQTSATHIIVLVNWGIDAVVVMQLPPDDELVASIDNVLKNICLSLEKHSTSSTLTQTDKNLLKQIIHTEIFSNIPDLTKINSVIDFCCNIPEFKNNRNIHFPYNYNLCPIQRFYNLHNSELTIYNELPEASIINIEHYLLQLSAKFKAVKTAVDQDFPHLQKHLKHQLRDARTQWSNLKEMYQRETQRRRDLVIDVRLGKIDQSEAEKTLDSDEAVTFRTRVTECDDQLNTMQQKEHLIRDLLQQGFQYQNAVDCGIGNGDNEQTIERKLSVDVKRKRILCSDDTLYKQNKPQWHTLYGQLLEEHEQNSQLQLIYVDFTYCSYKPDHIIIFPNIDKSNNVTEPKSTTSKSSERPKSGECINILFLGESGVGKSTFINAFVNYIHFTTLENACLTTPIVLIPVSFVMTIGDDFQEKQVKFGGQDSLSNEDHDHLTGSITQHCKSYVFTLKNDDGSEQKLRIIDTPGIGDTRGVAQDDINMQHILSYVNNLTYLNAVCILMKPNNARLNIFFRSCFSQLFDFLGDNARDKIIFCFTNTRSTFYTPGNTAPLLKTLLDSLPVTGIPFKKENSFCFDSDSFRYLMAVQNGIKFDNGQKEEYTKCWVQSSAESERLIDYICTKMTNSIVLSESRSMTRAQLKINLLIRPMLEAMRNILRNIVLWNTGSPKVSIELSPKIIKGPTAICFQCPRESHQFGDFWITDDALHVFHNKCRTCSCPPSEHISINYQLEYKPSDHCMIDSEDGMRKLVDDLCRTSAQFSYFLLSEVNTSQNDPFMSGLERMITEENDIFDKESSRDSNRVLIGYLEKLKHDYEANKKELADKKEQVKLSDIYDSIDHVMKYPIIELQMSAIKHWLKFMTKYYEYDVPI